MAFAYPPGQRCAGRSDGALRQPFSPCPPAVPAQGSGPQAVEFRSTDNPSLPMRMPYALRGNNGKDRKVKPCGGLLVDEDAQSIRTFYILQKPPIFLHKV